MEPSWEDAYSMTENEGFESQLNSVNFLSLLSFNSTNHNQLGGRFFIISIFSNFLLCRGPAFFAQSAIA